MKSESDKIIEEAMKLSKEERSKIACILFESMEPCADTDVGDAWKNEVSQEAQTKTSPCSIDN